MIAVVSLQACAGPTAVAPSLPRASAQESHRVLAPGLCVDLAQGEVRLDGVVSLNEGWLEQVACLQGTRDHEVLITTQVHPSAVHGALLVLGAEAGAPGSWSWSNGALSLSPPTGTPVDVLVDTGDGDAVPIATWIQGEGGRVFPDEPWRFAGSNFVVMRDVVRDTSGEIIEATERERYEADMSGSLIGIVTFGDEVLGWPEVLPHRLDVQDVLWEAAGNRMPPVGTPVTLVLRIRRDR